jgi:peptidoglycan/xylan/chitin deacetylase (PgdA/CDA1 family)
MILMYHKVDIIQPTVWWVTPAALRRQLRELDGREFVYLDDYDAPAKQVALTFDDAYENVVRHAVPMLRRQGVPFELFVVGDVIGDWNDDDESEPLTRYMSLGHLDRVIEAGGRVQWHTRTHRDLTTLEDLELSQELTVPDTLSERFPAPNLRWLAYPGGAHDERIVTAARSRFDGALSVIEGRPDDRWQLNRVTVEETTSFATPWLASLRASG